MLETKKLVNEKEMEENYGENLENWGDLPNFQGGFINFGYWKEISLDQPLSIEDRIKSSEDLYVFLASELNILKTDKILEIGCGRGAGIISLIKYFNISEIIGIDLVPAQINRAIEKIKTTVGDRASDRPLIKLKAASADATTLEDQSIDKILSVEIAQHFNETYSFAMEVKRILKPSGKLVFASHFPTSPENCHKIEEESLGMKSLGELSIQEVIFPFQELGFKVSYFPIGKYVLDGYEKWISQINCKTPCSHFFYKAYKKNYMDYFVIVVSY